VEKVIHKISTFYQKWWFALMLVLTRIRTLLWKQKGKLLHWGE